MIKFLQRRKKLSCEEIMEVLQDYLDGTVDEKTARKVASHLGECTMCAPEAEVYSRIKASLATKSLVVDPDVIAGLTTYGERLANGEFDD